MTQYITRGRRNTRNSRAARGFTLIELLLVMVILAILAALVVPKFTKRSEQAKLTAARTDVSNIGVSLDSFEVDCSRYPTTAEGLQALVTQPPNVTGWKEGGYLSKVPVDPWGHPYVYVSPGRHNTSGYDVCSCGPDEQDGTDDDIGNWTTQK